MDLPSQKIAKQQAVVAELGLHALQETDLQAVMDEAVCQVAETLEIEYCKVLELQPDDGNLLLKAGVGWKEGIVGHARVGTERGSQAGYTLLSDEPVIVDDLRTETRFSGPELLTSHDVVSGISVIIKSTQAPYGVMGAHTTQRRDFTETDAYFLQAVANLIGEAIERKRAHEALEQRVQERTADLRRKNALLQLMEKVAATSNKAERFDEALQVAVDAVCQYTGWPIGHVCWLAEASDNELVSTAIWNAGSRNSFETFREVTENTRFKPGQGFPGSVLKTKKPAWITDVMKDASFTRTQSAQGIGVKEAFAFPVQVDGDVVAVLEFFSDRAATSDEELMQVARAVGTQLGRVAERERATKALRKEIKQRKEAEAQLAERARELDAAYTKLKKTDRLKDEFFANVSHELRTPLTLILSPVESMLEQFGEHASSQRRMLGTIHNNAIRMLQMVNGLLDFSRLEISEVQVDREPTEIAELTRSIYQDFGPLIERNGLEARFSTAVDHPVVEVDRYLYERILFNLLSNAVKFTTEGGQIDVTLQQKRDRIELTVADTGEGIAEDELENIFKDFRQIDASATRRFEGTGLGLSLVREFAELLGGTVTVDSVPGEGSTFTVELTAPVSEQEAGAAAVEPSRTVAAQHGTSESVNERAASETGLPDVVLAEDNEELTAYIEELLAETCRLYIARDGQEALRLIRQVRPEAVITDIMMPKVDGIRLCQEVKADPTTADIPVVMLTALTNRKALMRGWEAGADEYLFKPFHPRELVTRIQTLLRNIKRRREAEATVRRLEQKLLRTNERERRRIGQDLHDGLASHLTGVVTLVTSLVRSGNGELSLKADQLREVADLAKEGARQARAMARGLNPVKLDKKGLAAALQTLAEDESLRFDVDCQFEQLGPTIQLAEEEAVNLYWIAHEAVRNALQHGEASRISIRLSTEEERIRLEVSDNGKGLPVPVEALEQGMGLETMRYRASFIGAALELTDSEQGGVCVRCVLPREGAGRD